MLVVERPTSAIAASGHPLIVACSQNPVAPVSWTFQHLPDSEAQDIITEGSVVSGYTERFGITDSSMLFIYKVHPNDVGFYNCCDANRDVFAHRVTVNGEEIANIL